MGDAVARLCHFLVKLRKKNEAELENYNFSCLLLDKVATKTDGMGIRFNYDRKITWCDIGQACPKLTCRG